MGGDGGHASEGCKRLLLRPRSEGCLRLLFLGRRKPQGNDTYGFFPWIPPVSCYTDFVPRNVTIRISDEAALWARRKAAEENTSVSRLVGEMLERQMRLSDEYWRAFEHWKSNRPLAGTGAAGRLSREAVHERR